MIVTLDEGLLDDAKTTRLVLLGICAFGYAGRHAVCAHPRARWDRWAEACPREVRDELDLAWDEGDRTRAEAPRAEHLWVTPSDRITAEDEVLRCPPDAAFDLLARPLRVLLENGRTDRAFLLAFAGRRERARLAEAERKGWLHFETAGGTGEIAVRTDTILGEDRELLRSYVLRDGDGASPGTREPEAQALHDKLHQRGRRWRRPARPDEPGYFGGALRRHAAESYAPARELRRWLTHPPRHGLDPASFGELKRLEEPEIRTAWAKDPGRPGEPRRLLLAAHLLGEVARDHPSLLCCLHLKEGWTRHDPPPAWVQALDALQRAGLEDGFGKDVVQHFYKHVSEGAQSIPDPSGEVVGILETLLRRL